jgi:two-component system response regulator NreC
MRDMPIMLVWSPAGITAWHGRSREPSVMRRQSTMHCTTRRRSGAAAPAVTKCASALLRQSYVTRGVSRTDAVIRVALVDDHTLVREGLRALLDHADDMLVLGEAEDEASAIALASHARPDVLTLDLEGTAHRGLSTLHKLRELLPPARVLVLSMYPEDARLVCLLEAGARGYLSKEASTRDLLDAVRVVASGAIYVRPAAARVLAADLVERQDSTTPRGRLKQLSARERTVLEILAQGYSGLEAARQLGVSGKTIDAYKHRIFAKLGLAHRTEYVRFALEAGVLAASPDARK